LKFDTFLNPTVVTNIKLVE